MKPSESHHKPIKRFIGILLFIFSFTCLLAQDNDLSNQAITDLRNETESVLGLDDELANGEIYYQKNLSAAGHPFYITSDWSAGSVTVNGKTHHNLLLKLNIEDGELIMKVTQKSGSISSIALNNGFVDSFDLDGHHFVSSQNGEVGELKEGFYEQMYKGGFSFFANFRKTFVSEYNTRNPHGKYSKTFVSYYIFNNGEVTKLPSKGAFLKYFEAYKKEIKRFMSQNKIKYNKAGSSQLHALMQYCDDLVNNE